jgi:hypothetical protein
MRESIEAFSGQRTGVPNRRGNFSSGRGATCAQATRKNLDQVGRYFGKAGMASGIPA